MLDEMDGASSRHGSYKKCIKKNWLKNLKSRSHLEDRCRMEDNINMDLNGVAGCGTRREERKDGEDTKKTRRVENRRRGKTKMRKETGRWRDKEK
jgi:hypothetical protein